MPLTRMRMWLCVLCAQVMICRPACARDLSQHVCGCTRLSPLRQNKDTDLHSLYIRFSTSYRRKFRSQTSDHIDRWKAEQGRGREKRKIRRKKSRRERVRRKKMQMREKVGKTRNTAFFPMNCGSGGSKSRLVKAAGAETSGEMRNEKLHAVVARSTFRSQNAKNTTCSDHFWKLRCQKSARRCGAKHISKSKCTKHTSLGPLLEVEMSKICTPLWRQVNFEVNINMYIRERYIHKQLTSTNYIQILYVHYMYIITHYYTL